jgi:hypothetical protein
MAITMAAAREPAAVLAGGWSGGGRGPRGCAGERVEIPKKNALQFTGTKQDQDGMSWRSDRYI